MSTTQPKKKTPWEQYLDDLVWKATVKSILAIPEASLQNRAGIQDALGNEAVAKDLYNQGSKIDNEDVAHEITKYGVDTAAMLPLSAAIIGNLGTLPLGGTNLPYINKYVSYAPFVSGGVDTLANMYYAKSKADSAEKPYGLGEIIEDAAYNAIPNIVMGVTKIPDMRVYTGAKIGSKAFGKLLGQLGGKAHADDDQGYEPDYIRR